MRTSQSPAAFPCHPATASEDTSKQAASLGWVLMSCPGQSPFPSGLESDPGSMSTAGKLHALRAFSIYPFTAAGEKPHDHAPSPGSSTSVVAVPYTFSGLVLGCWGVRGEC